MHSNCILDSVVNLLVRNMVFIRNVQKSPIASHLKGLDLSLNFCCQGLASSSSSAFMTMSSAKQKLVISHPPMLILPSWSSNASHDSL